MRKITIIVLAVFLLCTQHALSQSVGISDVLITPDQSSILELRSTNKGLLIPRVSLTQTTSNAPVGPAVATSLLVYNTATINDVTPGFYYWDGSRWVPVGSGASATQDDDWLPHGAANTDLIYHEGHVYTQRLNNVAVVGPYAFATIQDAINSLPATGGKVLVTEGTWDITAQITFPNNNITIEGVGKSTIINANGNHTIFYVSARDNIEIKNMTIQYPSYDAGSTGRNAIYLYRAGSCVITNCRILNAQRGVFLAGTVTKFSEFNNIHNNFIENCRYGVSTSAGITPTNYYVRYNSVHNNRIINSASYGVCFAGSSYANTISDNEIDIAVQGIAIFHSDSIIISNNRILRIGFTTSPGVGVCVQGSSHCFITDNYISKITGTVSNASGIRVIQQNGVWCYNSTITGNQIHMDGTMTGILVYSPIGAVISNNYIKNTSVNNAYPAIMVTAYTNTGSAGLHHPTSVVLTNNVVVAATTATNNYKHYSAILLSGNGSDTDNGPINCTVIGNSVSGYRRGITVSDGNRLIIQGNVSTSSQNGLYFNDNSNSVIIGNNGGGLGVVTTGGAGNEIHYNIP